MIVLAGASASGKTEVAKLLMKKYGIKKVITTTTRSPRVNEVNGKDYFFVTTEEFEDKIKNDEFVETTKFNSNYYGSTKDQIADDRCIVVDLNGLKKYIELNNNSIVSFFLDSSEEVRMKRMELRGDKKENIISRINYDKESFKKENVPNVNYHIDSETNDIEQVTDEIYNLYQKQMSR